MGGLSKNSGNNFFTAKHSQQPTAPKRRFQKLYIGCWLLDVKMFLIFRFRVGQFSLKNQSRTLRKRALGARCNVSCLRLSVKKERGLTLHPYPRFMGEKTQHPPLPPNPPHRSPVWRKQTQRPRAPYPNVTRRSPVWQKQTQRPLAPSPNVDSLLFFSPTP